jgi:hypothetical protein
MADEAGGCEETSYEVDQKAHIAIVGGSVESAGVGLKHGKFLAGHTIEVAFENDEFAVVDGKLGLGQSVDEQSMRLGAARCIPLCDSQQ